MCWFLCLFWASGQYTNTTGSTGIHLTKGTRSSIITSVGRQDRSTQRGVAQLGSASVLGTEGRRFESCHPDRQFSDWHT